MNLDILDPTHEGDAESFALAVRLPSLRDTTVGLLSNGKKGSKPFFDAIENELLETHGVAKVVRAIKSNFSAPADAHIMEQAKTWDALVAGVGD